MFSKITGLLCSIHMVSKYFWTYKIVKFPVVVSAFLKTFSFRFQLKRNASHRRPSDQICLLPTNRRPTEVVMFRYTGRIKNKKLLKFSIFFLINFVRSRFHKWKFIVSLQIWSDIIFTFEYLCRKTMHTTKPLPFSAARK